MNRHPRSRTPWFVLPVGLALAGCAQTDPYQRGGTWSPSGVNNANIAIQAANPADLARGRSGGTGTVRTATTAVDRLWRGAPQQAQQQQNPLGAQAGQRGGEAPR